MVKQLGLNSEGIYDKTTELYDESKTILESPARMRVFAAAYPLPKHSLVPGSDVAL